LSDGRNVAVGHDKAEAFALCVGEDCVGVGGEELDGGLAVGGEGELVVLHDRVHVVSGVEELALCEDVEVVLHALW